MKLIFSGKQAEAGGALSFRFRPVEPLTWIAGQSIKIELQAGYDTEERRFTIAAAPYEKTITITTRISDSDFKQALNSLTPGDTAVAHNIGGTFVWQESPTPHFFAANSIGVTPFYAMLKQRAHDHKPLTATLLYTSRHSSFVYGAALQQLAAAHPEFTPIFFPNQQLSAGIILRHKPQGLTYLAGPSAVVDQVGDALLAAGLSDARLIRDWFNGRPDWDR